MLTVEPEAELRGGVVGALRPSGYRPSPAQLQSSATVLVDLEGPEEALLARMSSTWRRYVRKAAREGVTVRQGTAADLPRFYELYLETSERDRFIPRPRNYIERLWGHLAPSGTVGLLLAEVGGAPEAALSPCPSAGGRGTSTGPPPSGARGPRRVPDSVGGDALGQGAGLRRLRHVGGPERPFG